MAQEHEERIARFIVACRRVAGADLVRFSSGNMSCRLDDALMAVTAKGAWLGELVRDRVALCRIADGAPAGGPTPSVESGFHAGIYRVRPDVAVVLHCQSPCATAVACGRPESFDFFIIPEVPFYVGKPAIVGYANPGSAELAASVIAAAEHHDLIILRNHGQVAVGASFDNVIQKAGFFELACEILLHGRDIRPLPPDGIAALRDRAAKELSARPNV